MQKKYFVAKTMLIYSQWYRVIIMTIGWRCLSAVILGNSVLIYLSIYVCPQNFCRCKSPGNRLTPGIAYLQIAYGQTAGVRNIFPNALCGCHRYVSP